MWNKFNYKDYLHSPEWKRKRDERRFIDSKCAICGSPIDLNVHHLTYDRIGDELCTDLVTLCRFHHQEIESRKTKPYHDSFGIFNRMLIDRFIKEHEKDDYSAHGNKDYCNLEVIKRDLFPFLKEHGANLNRLSGSSIIQAYFRNKRYAIILDYIEHNHPIESVLREYRFSYNMVRKVYKDPNQARRLIQY